MRKMYRLSKDLHIDNSTANISLQSATQDGEKSPTKRKTQAELDKEIQAKLAGIAGDGGEAGVEYEDGVPVAMKRGVRNNMFRYI